MKSEGHESLDEEIGGPESDSKTLDTISSMPLNLSDKEYEELARSEPDSREVSEDALIRYLQRFIAGERPQSNSFGTMLRILQRPSMQDSSHRKLLENGIRAIADRTGFNLGR